MEGHAVIAGVVNTLLLITILVISWWVRSYLLRIHDARLAEAIRRADLASDAARDMSQSLIDAMPDANALKDIVSRLHKLEAGRALGRR